MNAMLFNFGIVVICVIIMTNLAYAQNIPNPTPNVYCSYDGKWYTPEDYEKYCKPYTSSSQPNQSTQYCIDQSAYMQWLCHNVKGAEKACSAPQLVGNYSSFSACETARLNVNLNDYRWKTMTKCVQCSSYKHYSYDSPSKSPPKDREWDDKVIQWKAKQLEEARKEYLKVLEQKKIQKYKEDTKIVQDLYNKIKIPSSVIPIKNILSVNFMNQWYDLEVQLKKNPSGVSVYEDVVNLLGNMLADKSIEKVEDIGKDIVNKLGEKYQKEYGSKLYEKGLPILKIALTTTTEGKEAGAVETLNLGVSLLTKPISPIQSGVFEVGKKIYTVVVFNSLDYFFTEMEKFGNYFGLDLNKEKYIMDFEEDLKPTQKILYEYIKNN